MIRLFARDELESRDEVREIQRRHLAHVVDVVSVAAPLLDSGSDPAIVQHLEADHANLRLALSTAADEDPAALETIGLSLWRYWLARGHLREGIRYLDLALAPGTVSDPKRRSELLQGSCHVKGKRVVICLVLVTTGHQPQTLPLRAMICLERPPHLAA